MTYVGLGDFSRKPMIPGRAHATIDRYYKFLGQVGGADQIEAGDVFSTPHLNALEERLRLVQDRISEISMKLPKGFAAGLNRQFANLMDDDAWEDDDELVSPEAVTAFILTLLSTHTKRRPGIGTNGRGSITGSWTNGDNRLTIECLPNERVRLILSRRRDNGDVERAAFEAIRPERIRALLAPFNPEVWFDS